MRSQWRPPYWALPTAGTQEGQADVAVLLPCCVPALPCAPVRLLPCLSELSSLALRTVALWSVAVTCTQVRLLLLLLLVLVLLLLLLLLLLLALLVLVLVLLLLLLMPRQVLLLMRLLLLLLMLLPLL